MGPFIEVVKSTPTEVGHYVFIDVLEHPVVPLKYLKEILSVAKSNSYFVFGIHFYPFITCHFPSSSYLRHTFVFTAHLLGPKFISNVTGGGKYIQVFQLCSYPGLGPLAMASIARVRATIININSLMDPINSKQRTASKENH